MYTPDANRISGSGAMANGKMPYMGAIACPYSLPFGTRLEATGRVKEWLKENGIKTVFTCADRMAKQYGSGYVDIAIPIGWNGMDNQARIKKALEFGRIKSEWRLINGASNNRRKSDTE